MAFKADACMLRSTCRRKAAMTPLQVTEQMLKAFDVELCGDLITRRALLSALFSKVKLLATLHACQLAVSRHDKQVCMSFAIA